MRGGRQLVKHDNVKPPTLGSPVSSRTRSRINERKPSSHTATSTGSQKTKTESETISNLKQVKQGSVKKTKTTSKTSKILQNDKVKNTKGKSSMRHMSTPEPMDVDTEMEVPAVLQINTDEDICTVCMCEPTNPKKLDKCGHLFCTDCITQCFEKMNPVCPICGTVYGAMTGNMPQGQMNVHYDTGTVLPGYQGSGVIIIEYDFPNGTQTSDHPHPGKPYYGTHRLAYLPDNPEGRKVLSLLRRSFNARMTFTVGQSATTGLDDQVIWNDIHHKTRILGGPTSFGYPDPTYLNRVQLELASKGIK